jgi:predicted dehydrogenase
MITAAVEIGLHVLAEKPLARTGAEGEAAARLMQPQSAPCVAGATRVAVNYQYRYDSACYAMARAVQRGDLGEVRYARINVPWKRGEDYFRGAAWHASLEQAGGGTLLTQGSHFMDVALWACGQPVRSVMGHTARRVFTGVEVEDFAAGVVELANGAVIEICSSMVAASEGPATIEIYGSRATAFYRAGWLGGLRFEGRRVGRILREHPPVRGLHALQRSIEGFRRWAAGGEPHLVPVSEALPVLKAVEAVYRSAERGERVLLEQDSGGGG